MEILKFDPSEQRDIAVDLGVVPELVEGLDRLHMWNLRGQNADLTILRPKLEEQLARHQSG